MSRREALYRQIMTLYPNYLAMFPHGPKELMIHHYNVTDMRLMTVEQVEHLLGLIKKQMGVTEC